MQEVIEAITTLPELQRVIFALDGDFLAHRALEGLGHFAVKAALASVRAT